jgi:Na+/H+ antiporter NhaD/arsenite permease-like protein
MHDPMLAAVIIFAITYLAIASEKVNRTLAALLGAGAMVVFGVLDDRAAVAAVDFHTLGLLVGMMVIVGILRQTGLFQWLAIRTVKRFRGSPWKIFAVFFLMTAVASAFLDNVTTVLLMVPITLIIAEALAVPPMPFLIGEILASNIGGTATLVGDPPNIMIGSATGLSFVAFAANLAPLIAVVTVIVGIGLLLFYRSSWRSAADPAQAAAEIEDQPITDPRLLAQSLGVLALVIVGFLLHGRLGWQASTVAMLGATILILIADKDPHEVLASVEWSTIFFFLGLFAVVGGLQHTGALDVVARHVVAWTGGNVALTCFAVLWLSAVLSAIVDNIPCVAALIPVITAMAAATHPELSGSELMLHPDVTPIWWSLALGACLGGNGSLVGASANVVASGVAARAGHPISFARYLRAGVPFTLISLVLASIYIWLRYLL